MLTRPRRRSERGQVLALALAFLVYVFLIVFAALGFASATAQQHIHTELTAQSDAAGEGGAAFAAADAARTDISWCSGSDSGTLTMADSPSGPTTANYSVTKCNPGQTATTVGAKGHCLLCILNQTPFGSTAAHTPGTPVLAAQCAQCTGFDLQTIGGDDYINGSITSGTTLEACETTTACPGKASIGVLGSFTAGCCTPTPKGGIIVTDPLASIGDPSSVGAALPSGCTNWQTCKPLNCQSSPPPGAPTGTWSPIRGCSATGLSMKQTYNLYPGVWNTVTVSGNADVVMQPGVYVFTGLLSNSGKGVLCAPGAVSVDSKGRSTCTPSTGVTLYLACVGGVSSGQNFAYLACPASGQSGGSIDISGGGNAAPPQVSLSSTPCPAGQQVPQCPGYDGAALLADPHLIDPSTNSCITTGTSCAVSVSGNGGSINGSVDLRSAGLSIGGNGSEAISQGFLIVNSLYENVSGKANNGLSLAGPGAFASVGNACNILVLNVYTGAAPANIPAAVVQSQCGSAQQSGVIDFNYLP